MSHLPVIKSFVDPGALAGLLEQTYGFREARCTLIKATMRDVYAVTTRDARYVTILYPARATRAYVEAEIALTDHLTAHGFPAVTALATLNGSRLFQIDAPEGERCAVTTPFVNGAFTRQPSLDVIRQYGALVARLHLLTNDFPASASRPVVDRQRLLDTPLNALEAVLWQRAADVERLRQVASWVGPRLDHLPTEAPEYGVLHGDVIPSNLLIGPDGSLTLIDYDLYAVGYRVYDIASYLNEIAFWNMAENAGNVFLEGYEQVRPLSGDERAALPLFRIAHHIRALGIAADHASVWGTAIYLSDSISIRR